MKTDLFRWLLPGAWGWSGWELVTVAGKDDIPALGQPGISSRAHLSFPIFGKLSPKNSFPGQCSAPPPPPSAASSGTVPASVGTLRTCKPGRARWE